MKAVAIDLDGALADTRPLWHAWLEDAARRFAAITRLDLDALPEDRAQAALALDRWAAGGVGDWRGALERFAEDRVPVYVRPSAATSAALRRLEAAGIRLGVFSDAPEPLARIVLAHLGVGRRVEALETGVGALGHLLERLGEDTELVRTRDELLRLA